MQYIPVFLEAAKAGGKIVREYFGKNLETIAKTSAADFRTKADVESETAILAILEKAYPEFDILSEERGETLNGSEYTIVVDPLDGTNNFVSGIPNFTILITLLRGKHAIAGLIYHPMIDAAYYAEDGKGAFLNGAPIRVNNESDATHAALSFTAGYGNYAQQAGIVTSALYDNLHLKRVLSNWSGAADACLVACGKLEAIINDGNEAYDVVASKIIGREAGAKITDINGNPEQDDTNTVFLMSNGTSLHEKILESWRKVRQP